MKARHYLAGSLSALALTGIVSLASASSHREAPAIGFDPAADNTDVWAWVDDGKHDVLNVVTSYNPLEEPSGGPNYNHFSDDGLYEIHIMRGNKSLAPRRCLAITTNRTPFRSSFANRVRYDSVGGGRVATMSYARGKCES